MDKKIGTAYDYRQLREIINVNHDRFSELNYDTSLSLPQKMNALVEWFKVMLQEYDEWIKYLDEFQDKFDENLYTTTEEVLQKWTDDGIMDQIINQTVLKELNDKLDLFKRDTERDLATKISRGENEVITAGMIAPSLMNIITNGGEVSVNTSMIEDGAITGAKLSPTFSYKELLSNINLNDVTKSGLYVTTQTGITNAPLPNISALLEVKNYNSRIIQRFTTMNFPYYTYERFTQPSTSTYGEWYRAGAYDNSVSRVKLTTDYDSNGSVTAPDLNTLLSAGNYLSIGSATNAPEAINGNAIVRVTINGVWVHQEFRSLNEPNLVAYRYGRPALPQWGEWLYPTSGDSAFTMNGQTIGVFGDSQIGNTQDTTSVVTQISKTTSAEAINFGFGGCRMAKHESEDGWDWFSMYRLADELVKPMSDPTRFAAQETAAARSGWTSMPAYFPATVAKLKLFNPANADAIVIHYGTNDYTGGVLVDNPTNKLDTTTFGGALRYSLNKLMGAFPNLKIIVDTPTFRVWFQDGVVIEDSDTKEFNGQALPEFVDKVGEIGNEYKLDTNDLYFKLGVNKFNWSSTFTAPDGTHQNANGRKVLGETIGKKMLVK